MSPPRCGSSEHVVAEEGIDQQRTRFHGLPASQMQKQRPRRDTNANAEKNRSHTNSSGTSSVTTGRSFSSSGSRHSNHESLGDRSEGRMVHVERGGVTRGGRVRGRPSSSTASTAPRIDEEEVIRRRQERKARSARLLLDLGDRHHHRRSSNDNDGAQIPHRVKERVRSRSVGSSKSRHRSSMEHIPALTHDSQGRIRSSSRRRSMEHAPSAFSVDSATQIKTSLATGKCRHRSMEHTSTAKSETENSSSSGRMLQVLRRASMQHSKSFRRLSISNHPPPPVQEEDTSQKVEHRDSINSTSSFLSLKEEILPSCNLRHDFNSSFRRASLESEQCEVPPPTAPPQRNRTWSGNISSGGAILSMLGQGFRQETEATEDKSIARARSTSISSLPSRKSSILSGFISNLDKDEEAPSSSTSFFAKRKSSLESIGSNTNTANRAAAPCSSTSLPCVATSNGKGETSTDSSRWMLGLKREAVDDVPHADEDQSATTSMGALAETPVGKVNEVKQIGAKNRQTIRSSKAIPEVGSMYEVDTRFEPSTERLNRTERGRRRQSTFMDMVTNIANEAEKTAASSSSDSFMSRASQRASTRARNADPSIGNSLRPTSIVGSDVVGAYAAAAESMREDKRQGARSTSSKPPSEEMRVFNPNNSKDDLGKELWDSGTFEVVDGLITLAHPDDEGKEHHPVFNFL